jgi:hypothetical protein
MSTPSVLFVCVPNNGKSQMVAGLMREAAGDRVAVHSAGTNPGTSINALSAEVLAEVGAELESDTPRPIDPGLRCGRVLGGQPADQDTVRDVIHAFNERGWPRWTLSGREALLPDHRWRHRLREHDLALPLLQQPAVSWWQEGSPQDDRRDQPAREPENQGDHRRGQQIRAELLSEQPAEGEAGVSTATYSDRHRKKHSTSPTARTPSPLPSIVAPWGSSISRPVVESMPGRGLLRG